MTVKKIFFYGITISMLTITACSTNQSKSEKSNNNIATDNQPKHADNHKGAIHLTKAQFLEKVADFENNPQEWVYLGDKPCIIDFYADWCGPCKIAAPILEELANEYQNDIYVYKINTEQERELAAAFGIQSIPAFLFCPLKGNPQMSAGIAKTPEDTKVMFKQVIDEFLLQ